MIKAISTIFISKPRSIGKKTVTEPKFNIGVSRKLLRMIILILKKVLAIKSDVYTALRSSNKVTIRLAAGCCLVLSMFTSLLCKEKRATSAPDVIKLSNSKTNNKTIFRTALWGVAESR
jgi:hypothetical protein